MLSYIDNDGDLMGFASFELAGHRFEAWQPANDNARREFVVRVFDASGEKVREETVPMHYDNRFGVDIADKAALEQRTEEIIREMGLE